MMRGIGLPVVLVLGVFAMVGCSRTGSEDTMIEGEPAEAPIEVRFRKVSIEIEVGDGSVAGYQVELKTISGNALIVGVQGGTARGFTDPPYYDPAALAGGRVILAAMNPQSSLTAGRHRIAVVHLRESGRQPVYGVEVIAAGGADGRAVHVTAVLFDEENRPMLEKK